jgi:hypothetical protein
LRRSKSALEIDSMPVRVLLLPPVGATGLTALMRVKMALGLMPLEPESKM